jgi:hypothetical protein
MIYQARNYENARPPIIHVALIASFVLLHAQTAHAAPPNDDLADATEIPDLPFSDSVNTVDATMEDDDPDCYGNGPTVWYSYTATTTDFIMANTFGSSYDTTLSVYENGDQVRCNDDAGSLQSRVLFEAQEGVTYDIMVGSFANGLGGDLQFNMDVAQPLEIEVTLDPSGKVNNKTGEATISGTVFCSYPTLVTLYGGIQEKVNHFLLHGGFDSQVYCMGETAWSTELSAENGIFKGGKASADVTAYSYDDFFYDEDQVAQTIKLGGGGGGGTPSPGQCIDEPLPAPQVGTASFCLSPKTAIEAEADCVDQGGHLLSIHDPGMQKFAIAVASGLAIGDWWIGLDDIAIEGVYTWTDGSPFDFSWWNEGEPNNLDGNEDCVHLRSDGTWNDDDCEGEGEEDDQKYYICRLP